MPFNLLKPNGLSDFQRSMRASRNAHERFRNSPVNQEAAKRIQPRLHDDPPEIPNQARLTLGDALFSLLISMRAWTDFFGPLYEGDRDDNKVREAAKTMLGWLLYELEKWDVALQIGIDWQALRHIERALDDLNNGENNRLFVVGELVDVVGERKFSEHSRLPIRANAAAMVELLLNCGHERAQVAAARRVASTLARGGYVGTNGRPPTADTVKRWHNRVRKLEKEDTEQGSPDEIFYILYFTMLLRSDPKTRAGLPDQDGIPAIEFDPDTYALALQEACRQLRNFD